MQETAIKLEKNQVEIIITRFLIKVLEVGTDWQHFLFK